MLKSTEGLKKSDLFCCKLRNLENLNLFSSARPISNDGIKIFLPYHVLIFFPLCNLQVLYCAIAC